MVPITTNILTSLMCCFSHDGNAQFSLQMTLVISSGREFDGLCKKSHLLVRRRLHCPYWRRCLHSGLEKSIHSQASNFSLTLTAAKRFKIVLADKVLEGIQHHDVYVPRLESTLILGSAFSIKNFGVPLLGPPPHHTTSPKQSFNWIELNWIGWWPRWVFVTSPWLESVNTLYCYQLISVNS